VSSALAVLGGAYDERGLAVLRLLLAVVGVLALLYEELRQIDGRPLRPATRARAGVLLAVLGATAYFQFFTLRQPHFIHRSEAFHYYIGSKYFPELGYEGLYRCAAVATAERGGPVPAKIRDLHSNTLVATEGVLADPERCKSAFTPGRWASFSQDIDYFWRSAGASYWAVILQDHGYNASPAWGVAGRLLGECLPASTTNLRGLAALDLLLMAGAVGMLGWAWGWRVASLAALFWGTQAASTLYWIGGSILRQDWVFGLLAALCFLRRGRPALAGAALGYAALVRVFPAVFFAGAAVVAVARRAREGAWKRGDLRFFGGALALALALLPASVATAGAGAWPAFVGHIGMHDGTPTTNRMGWKAIVSHTAAGRMELTTEPAKIDPFGRWKELRAARLRSVVWLYRGGVALALVVFVWACARARTLWLAVALGAALLPVVVGLSCYYYSFLVALCPLSRARKPVELAALVVAALSEVAALRYTFFDDRYVAMSVLFTAYGAFVLLLFSPAPRPPARALS